MITTDDLTIYADGILLGIGERRRTQTVNEYQRDQMRRRRADAADVDIPPVQDPERRAACAKDLTLYARTYRSRLLYLPFVSMHYKFLGDLQHKMMHGGRVAAAFPRVSGKTTLILIAIEWALVNGHVRWVIYVCETALLAEDRIGIIKARLADNDDRDDDHLFAADYPEVCACVRALEGNPQRATSQKHKGISTNMRWKTAAIRLPTIAESASSGARLSAIGLGGGARGTLDDIGRPDCIIIDDPQGDESAESPAVIRKRRKKIQKGLTRLGTMAGVTSMVMACTIIEHGDLAYEFTDREQHPVWGGIRYPFLAAMPDAEILWEQYVSRRRTEQEAGDQFARGAHAWYLEHRAEMDAGAVVTLPHLYAGRHVVIPPATETKNILPDGSEIEASAIQAAYNVIADDGEEVFWSELQNEPRDERDSAGTRLTVRDVMASANNYARRDVPRGTSHIVAYIDVGTATRMTWAVVAWSEDFQGAVVDYGRFPQGRQATLAQTTGERSVKGQIRKALDAIVDDLCAVEWRTEGGEQAHLGIVLVDSSWGQHADTVYKFCLDANRRHAAALAYPARGDPARVGQVMFNDRRRLGTQRRTGDNWRIHVPRRTAALMVTYDTNIWKSRCHDFWLSGPGQPCTLSVFGSRPEAHREFAEEITAETWQEIKDRQGRKVLWGLRPGRSDNHYLDVITGCCVGGAILGCRMPGEAPPGQTLTFPQMQARWRAEHGRG